MPFGFAHLVTAWVCGRLYTRFAKTKLTDLMWAALLLGAIIPDADFLIHWTTCYKIHRTFSHSFVGVIGAGFVSYGLLKLANRFKKISRPGMIALFLSIGVMTHIATDLISSESGVQVWWPFEREWVTLNGPLNHYDDPPSYEELKKWIKVATFDIGLGVAWLAYLFWRKKVRFD